MVPCLKRLGQAYCGANSDYTVIVAGGGSVANGSYAPLSRYIYMNVNNYDWDLVRGFIAYGYSDDGMDHVMDVGYVALPEAMIEEMIARMG